MSETKQKKRLTSRQTNSLHTMVRDYGIDFFIRATLETCEEIKNYGNKKDKQHQPENFDEIINYLSNCPKV